MRQPDVFFSPKYHIMQRDITLHVHFLYAYPLQVRYNASSYYSTDTDPYWECYSGEEITPQQIDGPSNGQELSDDPGTNIQT